MKYALAIALLCAPAYGAIVNEIELGDTPETATPISQSAFGAPVNFGVSLPTATLLGTLDSGRSDVDYFSFFGTAGATLVIDADTKSLPGKSSDLMLRLLFNSQQIAFNDDGCGSIDYDPESTCHDPFIGLSRPFFLPDTGTYQIGVLGWQNYSPGAYLIQVSMSEPDLAQLRGGAPAPVVPDLAPVSVPEPSTLALLLAALFGITATRKKKIWAI